ncbi:MAG: hypothetical protein C4324_02140 [Blastocatellia bacterium]
MTADVAKRLAEITVDPKTVKVATATRDAAPAVDLTGKWLLTISAGGQSVVVRAEIKQVGGIFSGTTDSDLGSGSIIDGKVNGNSFSATLRAELQGQRVDIAMEGTADGKTISGKFSNPAIGNLPFTAVKEN